MSSSTKIHTNTFVRQQGSKRRLADEFEASSDKCVIVVENTVAKLIEACFNSSEQVSDIYTLNVTSDNGLLSFNQDLTIEGQVAARSSSSYLNVLQKCVDESVMAGNTTKTIQANAEKGECIEFEDAVVERVVLIGADTRAPSKQPTQVLEDGLPGPTQTIPSDNILPTSSNSISPTSPPTLPKPTPPDSTKLPSDEPSKQTTPLPTNQPSKKVICIPDEWNCKPYIMITF